MERRVGTLIHSETPVDRTRVWFLSTMTANILFNSAVTTGVTQNRKRCIRSLEHPGQLMAELEISARLFRGGITAR